MTANRVMLISDNRGFHSTAGFGGLPDDEHFVPIAGMSQTRVAEEQ